MACTSPTLSNLRQEQRDLWKNCDHIGIRAWARNVIRSDSTPQSILYRAFATELDVDADLGHAADSFRRSALEKDADVATLAQDNLRLIWQLLLRHIAICSAFRVDAVLREWGEPWYWTLWRRKDVLMLRLLAGVATGFLVLPASSGLFDVLARIAQPSHWPGYLSVVLGSVCIVYMLAIAEIQRRVARRPWHLILWRALYLTALGTAYAILGGLFLGWAASHLNMPWMTARLMIVWSSSALLLGFILQLFWEERPLGDPL